MSGRRNRWDLGPDDKPGPMPTTSPAAQVAAPSSFSDRAPEATPTTSEQSSRRGSVHVDFPAPTPDDFAPSAPQEFPGLSWGRDFPITERDSVLDAIRQLPQESIVAQFARGTCTLLKSPTGAVKTEATVDKPWHQSKARWNKNQHITVQLEWMDEWRNLIVTFGRAHLHENQLEMIIRYDTGRMMVRSPGHTTWTEHRACDPNTYLPNPSGQPPPWTQETGLVTDAEVGREAWRRLSCAPFLVAPAGPGAAGGTPMLPPPRPPVLPSTVPSRTGPTVQVPVPSPVPVPAPAAAARARGRSTRRNQLDRAVDRTNLGDYY
ncbi:hypothetical protein PMIN06_005776 [Paraphaeosphaeria minitans]